MSKFSLKSAEEMGKLPYITQGELPVRILRFEVPENSTKPAIDLFIVRTDVEYKKEYEKSFRLYYSSDMATNISNARIIHMAKELGIEKQVRAIEEDDLESFAKKLTEIFKNAECFMTIHGEEYISSSGLLKIKPILPIGRFCSKTQGKYPFDPEKHIKKLNIEPDEEDYNDDLPEYLR